MTTPFHAHFAQRDDRRRLTHRIGLEVRRGLFVCRFLLCFLASIQFPELAHGHDNPAPVWKPEIRITGTPGSMVGFYARFSDWGERGEAFDTMWAATVGLSFGAVVDQQFRMATSLELIVPYNIPLSIFPDHSVALSGRWSAIVEWVFPISETRWEIAFGPKLGITFWWMEDLYSGIGYHVYGQLNGMYEFVNNIRGGAQLSAGFDITSQRNSIEGTDNVDLFLMIQFDLMVSFRF